MRAPLFRPYPSDLTEQQWAIIEPLLPPEPEKGKGGRPVEHPKRRILDTILYVLKEGCSWRGLPHDFPHPQLVFHYFTKWKKSGDWERIHDALVVQCRQKVGKDPSPSAGILDSQTAKTSDQKGERGYDAGKKIKGRKRHILVDTLGLIIALVVHTADIQDRDGAELVLDTLGTKAPRLELIWADGGYAGENLEEYVATLRDEQDGETEIELEIVKRSDDTKGFKVLPRRWIVERVPQEQERRNI